MNDRYLCNLDEIEDPGSARFALPEHPSGHSLCIVRVGKRITGFINSCPHTGAPLDWLPGQFLDDDGEEIVCSMHGARFRIVDGFCVWGPCHGRSLQSVKLRVNNDAVHLAWEEIAKWQT